MSIANHREHIAGTAFVLTAQMLFGTTFAVNKIVLNEGVDPGILSLGKVAIVCLCLLPFARYCKGETRWSPADWRRAMAVGGLAYTAGMYLEYIGTKFTMASNVSLIVSTEAAFAVFLCVIFLKEKLHYTTIVGGVFAVIGVFMVVFRDIRHIEFRWGTSLAGDLLVLTAVVAWGFYTVFSKKILDHSNPIYSLFFVSLFSACTLLPINLAAGTMGQFAAMTPKAWTALAYLGVFGSCLGMICYFEGLKRLPASVAALTLTLLPVFGVLFSVILLNERLALMQMLGAAVIVVSVGFVVYPREREIPITEDSFIGT